MTAARAIEAASERLRALGDDESRLLGAVSEAASATREVPLQFTESFRKLVATGALQRRWDALVARAEATCDTGEDALLTALLGLLQDASGVVGHLLGQRELLTRQRCEASAQERRTLEWVMSESSREGRPASQPPPPTFANTHSGE